MSELRTKFWIDALRWRAEAAGAAVYVVRRGDPDAGVALVKLVAPGRQARLFAPARDSEGGRVWTQPLGAAPLAEADVDAYVARRADRDPDLWLIEVDDPHGRDFLNEPLEKS